MYVFLSRGNPKLYTQVADGDFGAKKWRKEEGQEEEEKEELEEEEEVEVEEEELVEEEPVHYPIRQNPLSHTPDTGP